MVKILGNHRKIDIVVFKSWFSLFLYVPFTRVFIYLIVIYLCKYGILISMASLPYDPLNDHINDILMHLQMQRDI